AAGAVGPVQVGWVDLTDDYLMQYTVGGASYGVGGAYTTNNVPAYTGPLSNGGGYAVNPFAAHIHPDGTTGLGVAGNTIIVDADNTITAVAPNYSRSGQFEFTWNIATGTSSTTPVPYGPITLVNPNASTDVVADSWVGGTYNTTNTGIPH